MTASITVIFLLGIAGSLLAVSIKRIPEGQVYTLHRRHRKQPELLMPGMHWIMPLRDHVAHKISLTGRTLRLDLPLAGATKPAHVQGKVYWQVLDPERADAVIDRADEMIRDSLRDGLRDDHTLDAALRNARLKTHLNSVLRPQGVLVTRVDVTT